MNFKADKSDEARPIVLISSKKLYAQQLHIMQNIFLRLDNIVYYQ